MLEGPKCLVRLESGLIKEDSFVCGPSSFCWNGFCRDTIFERTCELYKCKSTDEGWTWWDLVRQIDQKSKPGFACDRDVNTKCSEYNGLNVHGNYMKKIYCSYFKYDFPFWLLQWNFHILILILDICAIDKDCKSPYKYCDFGICVKGERPLTTDVQH